MTLTAHKRARDPGWFDEDALVVSMLRNTLDVPFLRARAWVDDCAAMNMYAAWHLLQVDLQPDHADVHVDAAYGWATRGMQAGSTRSLALLGEVLAVHGLDEQTQATGREHLRVAARSHDERALHVLEVLTADE